MKNKCYDTQTIKKVLEIQINNGRLINACQYGELDKAHYLLESPEVIHKPYIAFDDYHCLRKSCQRGCLDILKYLLTSSTFKKLADVHAKDDEPFR